MKNLIIPAIGLVFSLCYINSNVKISLSDLEAKAEPNCCVYAPGFACEASNGNLSINFRNCTKEDVLESY